MPYGMGVGMSRGPKSSYHVRPRRNSRSPQGREPHGDGAPIVVRVRESRTHGEGGQVDRNMREEVGVCQSPNPRDFRELESRVPRKSQARFGGGRMEKMYR